MTGNIQLSNYEKFIRVFNTLHEVLGEKLSRPNTQFGELLKYAEKNNDKVVMNYKNELDFYREFRNLLVHKATVARPPVAEPNQYLINEIVKVTERIRNPKKVYELFLSDVNHFQIDDSLSVVLQVVREKEYSQFPVFENNKLLGLISENGITRFLAKSVEDDLISIKETTIRDVIVYDEAKDSLSIVNTNTLIHDVKDIFNKKTHEGNSVFAILVSKNERKINSPGDIEGIITPWDLPVVMNNL